MSVQRYLPRVVDDELRDRLSRIGAVLIEGAKGCGKTETATQHCASAVRLDTDDSARVTAEIAPGHVLEGAVPRLIDEWQLVPRLWNEVRRAVDARRLPGQFVLTGSATPADDETRHTGAGRVSRLRLRPLTLWESGLSSGTVSLRALMDGNEDAPGEAIAGRSRLTLDDFIEEVCHGGWPADRDKPWQAAQANVADYCAEIADADIRTVDGVRRNPVFVHLLMQSLARHTAAPVRLTTLASDSGALAPGTVATYLQSLERLMILEPLPSWSPVLRDRARIRRAASYHFVDPALSASLLNARPGELRHDLKTFGFLFESLAMRDLRVYAQSVGARVHHYRDSNDHEIDAIIDGGYGRWGAVEIKLGGAAQVIDKAAANLLSVVSSVDDQSMGQCRFVAVVTATGYAYRRPDGVAVIPLDVLKP
ncbi:MAG: DUF4143 domain-containing protein [Micrococcales bacterium]|nr:DUF4143 domain-containing protein [Micrococcales bacterium]